MPKKIILDVDTGSDDACAIMLAHFLPEIEIEAVCTVKGNQPIDNTTENTLRVRQLLGADWPVYRGCSTSIVRGYVYPSMPRTANADAIDEKGNKVHIHEPLLDLPSSERKEEDMPAPIFYVDYLRRCKEKVTIVATGPLTNLAVAFTIDPSIADKIEELVIMGGAWNITNATLASEFNIYDDPEAAQRVLHCGARIVLVPLDCTHAAYIGMDDVAELKKIGTPASLFAAKQIELRILVHDQSQPLPVPHTCAVHDAVCVAYLVDPEVLVDLRFCNVEVSLTGFTEGQTCVDQRYYQENRNVWFAFSGSHERFSKIFVDAFRP